MALVEHTVPFTRSGMRSDRVLCFIARSKNVTNSKINKTYEKLVLNTRRDELGILGRKGLSRALSSCCSHIVIIPGCGDTNYQFKTVDETVSSVQRRFKEKFGKIEKTENNDIRTGTRDPGNIETDGRGRVVSRRAGSLSSLTMLQDQVHRAKALRGRAGKEAAGMLLNENTGVDGTLWVASHGVWQKFDDGRFDAIVLQRFGPLMGPLNQARKNAEPKYQPVVESLDAQLNKLRTIYKSSIPRLVSWLSAQNPRVSEEQLLKAVMETLDEEMSEILYVLSIYTDAFAQHFSGLYPQLQAVTDCLEDGFRLFETGDLLGSTGCRPKLKCVKFKTGNVFVVRLGFDGPATIPARGPIGAHAVEVPANESSIITIMLVLYLHELRHDLFADVEGLSEELAEVVAKAIKHAAEKGEFSFTELEIKIGRSKVSIVDLFVKLFSDSIGEIDADISGGILMSGWAYLLNMLMTFVALNCRNTGVFKSKKHFEAEGEYVLTSQPDGSVALDFEEHPPDYVRAYLSSFALQMLGFAHEAEYCRKRADQSVGFKIPQHIIWTDGARKSKMQVKIRWADLIQVLPVVAHAIMFSPLKSLGGLKQVDVVNWTRHREKKVQTLAKLLAAGKSDLPPGLGDIYTTYIAAAATHAYWNLSKGGVLPHPAMERVESAALEMIAKLRANRRTSEKT